MKDSAVGLSRRIPRAALSEDRVLGERSQLGGSDSPTAESSVGQHRGGLHLFGHHFVTPRYVTVVRCLAIEGVYEEEAKGVVCRLSFAEPSAGARIVGGGALTEAQARGWVGSRGTAPLAVLR